MRKDTLQTFQQKFQNNFFFIKKSRFQVYFCYKKLLREDTLQTFQKKFQNNFFLLNKVDFKYIFLQKINAWRKLANITKKVSK
jgi:hypothetical protein